MKKKNMIVWGGSLAFVAVFCLAAMARPAAAVPMALSINFTNTGVSVGGNTAGVDGYGNWNDMSAPGTFSAAGSLKLSDGTTAGTVKVDGFSGWGSSTGTAPTGGGIGDQDMLIVGPRIHGQTNGTIYNVGVIQISGLSSVFSSGFEVRSYQNFLPGYQSSAAAGDVYVSNSAADFGLPTGQHTNPSVYNTANVVATAAWGPTTNTGFSGNYLTNGFYTTTGNIASNPDLIVIHFVNDFSNNGFSAVTWSGLQLVGDVAPIPEPSTLALAGLGLVGLAGFGLRRRGNE